MQLAWEERPAPLPSRISKVSGGSWKDSVGFSLLPKARLRWSMLGEDPGVQDLEPGPRGFPRCPVVPGSPTQGAVDAAVLFTLTPDTRGSARPARLPSVPAPVQACPCPSFSLDPPPAWEGEVS